MDIKLYFDCIQHVYFIFLILIIDSTLIVCYSLYNSLHYILQCCCANLEFPLREINKRNILSYEGRIYGLLSLWCA